MNINIGIGYAFVTDATGIVGEEVFTPGEFAALADTLESLNAPGNVGTPLRRLTDLLWALQNDTSAMVLYSTEGE